MRPLTVMVGLLTIVLTATINSDVEAKSRHEHRHGVGRNWSISHHHKHVSKHRPHKLSPDQRRVDEHRDLQAQPEELGEVDEYLWEAYQRTPIKEDSSGDFTWKDYASADRLELTVKDYVIGGMEPRFRKQLYEMGKAADEAGYSWSILSAFRDDYRQRIAEGYKASVGNSWHGGSNRGGYGHGRAIDVSVVDGANLSNFLAWFDRNGHNYGLVRPMKFSDPCHIQAEGLSSVHNKKHGPNKKVRTKRKRK